MDWVYATLACHEYIDTVSLLAGSGELKVLDYRNQYRVETRLVVEGRHCVIQ